MPFPRGRWNAADPDEGWVPRHAFDMSPSEWLASRPKARDPGEYTDASYQAPPPSTLSLAYSSIAIPDPPKRHPNHFIHQQSTGPVPSLSSLSALQLARNLELVDEEHLREGANDLPVGPVRALAQCLVEPEWDTELGGMLRLGNWVNLGMEWGPSVMVGLPEIRGRDTTGGELATRLSRSFTSITSTRTDTPSPSSPSSSLCGHQFRTSSIPNPPVSLLS